MILRTLAPEASASTNSATWASYKIHMGDLYFYHLSHVGSRQLQGVAANVKPIKTMFFRRFAFFFTFMRFPSSMPHKRRAIL